MLTLQPDGDLYEELVRLTDAGVEFVGEVSQHAWGRIASFKDSEGNDLAALRAAFGVSGGRHDLGAAQLEIDLR